MAAHIFRNGGLSRLKARFSHCYSAFQSIKDLHGSDLGDSVLVGLPELTLKLFRPAGAGRAGWGALGRTCP